MNCMKITTPIALLAKILIMICLSGNIVFSAESPESAASKRPAEYGTITEQTPSIPQYFSWINNTNEGSTEAHTMANLAFFKWLHDEYGMKLGIYAWDAGNIDSARYYGSMQTEKFKRQFPNGWGDIAKLARSFSCRLGVWGGPDGFGDTPEEEAARVELLVSLCRDYGLQLFKFDSVCGQLRDEKQATFARAMAACRKYAPDLIVLNHRLNLGEAKPHATTFLWGGAETYIDVHMRNRGTAVHNRLGALSRGLPPELKRLTEDHGVCISSCLDFWEDDLILQAFNRCLILAPEIYGNPWLLRDDEFAKLSRIFNLHYRARDILVKGMVLPREKYGLNAVARGDGSTRYVTLRNLTWEPVQYAIKLDEEIGLTGKNDKGTVEVRRYHPAERILGTFPYGETVQVEVQPFRAYLLMATVKPCSEVGISGCDYEVVRDTPGMPVLVKLLGLPGTNATVSVRPGARFFTKGIVNGENVAGFLDKPVKISFPGKTVPKHWHKKLADLKPVDVPADAEQLYEATCFKAENSALEVQSLNRSGPTQIPQVKKARDAFFNQALFWRRGIWDEYMFDGNLETFFSVFHYRRDKRIDKGALRLDMGRVENVDKISIAALWPCERDGQPAFVLKGEVSADLKTWRPVVFKPSGKSGTKIKVANITHNGGAHELYDTDVYAWWLQLPHASAIRYLRLYEAPERVTELAAWKDSKMMDRSKWHATNLFAPYTAANPVAAWQADVQLDADAPKGSYLCVALEGLHGRNKAIAALRVNDQWIGASHRAPSFPCVVWEYGPSQTDRNNTYFFPVTEAIRGKSVSVVVLGLSGGKTEIKPHVWCTAYPAPFASMDLRLE